MPFSRIAAGTVALASLGLLGYWLSRPAYPPVSPAAYQCTTALYTVCNQRASQRLPKIVEVVQQTHARGELQPAERAWLLAIIEAADRGDWQAAAAECRELLECQVTKDQVTKDQVTKDQVTKDQVTKDQVTKDLAPATGGSHPSRPPRR